ncbi:MAG: hypothetical protein D3910_05415 [Candidatus Electrothrix sp. ATG2]|nr:hypothetical protein [Candidatus Electrothrix sp. ATG2]
MPGLIVQILLVSGIDLLDTIELVPNRFFLALAFKDFLDTDIFFGGQQEGIVSDFFSPRFIAKMHSAGVAGFALSTSSPCAPLSLRGLRFGCDTDRLLLT